MGFGERTVVKTGEKLFKKIGFNIHNKNDLKKLHMKTISDIIENCVRYRIIPKQELIDFLKEQIKEIEKEV